MTPALFTHSTCSPQNAHRAFRQHRDNSIIVFRLILEIRMETCYFQITLYLMSAFAGLPVPHGRALVRKFSLVIATFSVPRVIEPPEMTFGDSTECT